jgi:hypothetical protein
MTVARMPFAKEVEEVDFADTPINETPVRAGLRPRSA